MQKICCFWLEFVFFGIEFFLECSKVKPDLKVNVAKIGVKESVKWNTFFFLILRAMCTYYFQTTKFIV